MSFLKKYSLTIILIFLILLFGISNPVFISLPNLLNLIDQISIIGIIALGMTLVIIIGGIDLSVGSIVAFTGLILASSLVNGIGLPLSFVFCLITGVIFGLTNGVFIAYFKVPPFIATLGLMSIARGASLYFSEGRAISNLPINLTKLVSFELLGISFSTLLFLTLSVIFGLFMKYTYWGKYIYAIGGNEKASWLSGIPIKKYKIFVYVISGLVCSLGSLILVGKLNSAQPQAGNMYELNVIAAVVIGGASLSGGKGSVFSTFLGVLILGVLQNGFSILNISSYFQQLLLGIIVIFAVILDNKKVK